jgi:hypothetical protein
MLTTVGGLQIKALVQHNNSTIFFIERRMGAERLLQRQALFQAMHGKHIHLKLPSDKLTSVVIPLAFVATTFALMFRGMWHMTHGTGKN